MKKEFIIFTDGSSRGNPGPGGWGAIVVWGGNVKEIGGREANTTNNRMELSAAIGGLGVIPGEGSVVVYTDSKYLINGITEWVFGWQKSGWKTKTKDEVLNRDLWEQLLAVTRGKKIEWKYIGGHVGIVGNERADEIATAFADEEKMNLYEGSISEYGKDILNMDLNVVQEKEKSSSRSHSKAKAYSYLSLLEGKLERHTTWAECEKRVKGKPAKFKKAVSAEDEGNILKEWGIK